MRIGEGVVVAGRYRLEKPLARGGMGSIWVAQHTQLDAPVAIKFMDPLLASSSGARTRFQREARAAAKIQSPHIVSVHDYGIEDETPFLVMELLHGEDLGTRIKRVGPLSLAVSADIIAQVARALRIAHAAGIVHRDLKPGNIFLVQNDDAEIAKVLDFGIAKTAMVVPTEEATHTDQILGSPHYMSPEQTRRSRDVDARSDLWALSVIAYRMVAGKLPFTGELGDVLVKICTEAAPPPSIHNPELSPTIDRFFERALAKSPDHRFQTAAALAQTFALAAGVNLPSVERERPRKPFSNTVPLRSPREASASPTAAAAMAARAESTSSPGLSPEVPPPTPSSPSSPSLEAPISDLGPESTTRPQPASPRTAEAETAADAGRAPARVFRAVQTTERMAGPARPREASARWAAPRAKGSPTYPWRSIVGTIAATAAALALGTIVGGRLLGAQPVAVRASESSPTAQPIVAARDTRDSSPPIAAPPPVSPPVAPATGAVPEAPRPSGSSAQPATASSIVPPPRVALPKRAPAAAPEPPKPAVTAEPAPPPPPPPAPPPTAPHRMFGAEN